MEAVARKDVEQALQASEAKRLAQQTEVVTAVWRVLNVSADLLAEAHKSKGAVSNGSVASFAVNKTLAVAQVGASQSASQAVKGLTFAASTFVGSLEMGLGAARYAQMGSPGKAATLITLKTAEKIVAAAGLGRVDPCKQALAALTANAGIAVFTCAASGGALCILGAAGFALEAFNAHQQCKLPPPPA